MKVSNRSYGKLVEPFQPEVSQTRWEYPAHKCVKVIPKAHHLPDVADMESQIEFPIIQCEFGWSIPSMFGENGVWYIGIGSLSTNLFA